jgi:iron(III) transport system substrate-binding protein
MSVDDRRSRSMRRRALLQLGAAALAAPSLLRSRAAYAASDPALIEAAKKEGTVSLYSSASTGPSNAAAETFKKAYGIDVQVYRGEGRPAASRRAHHRGTGLESAHALSRRL